MNKEKQQLNTLYQKWKINKEEFEHLKEGCDIILDINKELW